MALRSRTKNASLLLLYVCSQAINSLLSHRNSICTKQQYIISLQELFNVRSLICDTHSKQLYVIVEILRDRVDQLSCLKDQLLLYTGIKMTRSTAERIAHKHRDPLCDRELVRVIQPIKSCLPYDLRDLRVEFAHWIMQKMENNTCFHMWLRKKPKMTSAEQGVRRHAGSIILSQDRVRPPLGKKEERKTRSFDRLIPHLDYVPTGSLV